MRLFLDANVLFTAAHNPAGKAALVFELGKAGIWRLVIHPALEGRGFIATSLSEAYGPWFTFRLADPAINGGASRSTRGQQRPCT